MSAPQPSAPDRRVRVPLLVVAAAALALAVVIVLWAVAAASERTDALVVARPVAAGEVITADAITTSPVALDDGFGRVYTADQFDVVAGAVALVELEPGDLIGPSLVTGAPETADGERLVGAVLRSGRFPVEADAGDAALAVRLDDSEAGDEPIAGRIVSIAVSETGEARLTLAVDAAAAPTVAAWAGRDELVVVIEPLGSPSGGS